MRISDWSSDVCSSDLRPRGRLRRRRGGDTHSTTDGPVTSTDTLTIARFSRPTTRLPTGRHPRRAFTCGLHGYRNVNALRAADDALSTKLSQYFYKFNAIFGGILRSLPWFRFADRKSKRLNSSQYCEYRMQSYA